MNKKYERPKKRLIYGGRVVPCTGLPQQYRDSVCIIHLGFTPLENSFIHSFMAFMIFSMVTGYHFLSSLAITVVCSYGALN